MRAFKKNIIRTMILKKTFQFFYRRYSNSTVGRWGLWMNKVIVEVNSTKHRRHLQTILVTKSGRLITHNTYTNHIISAVLA